MKGLTNVIICQTTLSSFYNLNSKLRTENSKLFIYQHFKNQIMETRINIHGIEPKAYEAMLGLEKYLAASVLDKKLIELIKIRASQINACAYCIDMHTKDALKYGESPRRIFAVSAWWESPLFNEKERVALKMTEEITLIANNGLTSETYQKAKANFSDNEIAQIIMQIVTINSWNRIAVSTHMVHED